MLTAKEIKRRHQVPWQPKQRPQFSQTSEQTGTKSAAYGQARGRGSRGRGTRGRVVARNLAWVSGGVLKAGDFLGLHDAAAQDGSQFNADEDYMQLAETARQFAAASGSTPGYEMYGDYQGLMPGMSAQDSGQAYAQQGQRRGGANSSSSMFTTYGSYTAHTGASQVKTPSTASSRGRGRGFGVTRGGGGGGKPAGAAHTTYSPRFTGSSEVGFGVAAGGTTPQLMQTARVEQYATADSYTPLGVGGGQQQQQQQLYETYPGYDYADTSAAYSQTGYYATTDGHYLTTDTGVGQYYSQF